MNRLQKIPQLLRSRRNALTFLFCLAGAMGLIGLTGLPSIQAQELPDTPAVSQLVKVIECLNEKDADQRLKIANAIFDGSFAEEEIIKISAQIHEETGGLEITEILKSEKFKVTANCTSKRGGVLKFTISVSNKGKHLISDIGIGTSEAPLSAKQLGDLVPVIGKDEKTFPTARGIWLAKGYGYILEVTADKITAYSVAGEFGWKSEMADDETFYFKQGDSKDKALFTLHPKEPGYNVVRLDSLPAGCRNDGDQPKEWTPTKLFAAFNATMKTYYPFFEARNFDWDARLKEQQPKVSDDMTESELFDVMAAMLENLHDGHTGLRAEIDGKRRSAKIGYGPTIRAALSAFEKQTEFESKSDFVDSIMENVNKQIDAEILQGKATRCCDDKIIWGRAHEKVGYILIDSMYGFATGGIDKQVTALHKSLDEILGELADTDALIIDISMNGGGSDLFSMEIAAHFADKKRIGFSKWPATAKEYRNDRYVTPYRDVDENGVMYTKPVYLVTNDLTASAAEIFTMCMRAMPNVTTIGKPTEGALSDIFDKSLPNGWVFHTSNEVYVDHEGVCYEGPGVPPKIEMDIFDMKDVTNGNHRRAIGKIVEMAIKDTAKK